jgi:hypothetical protein
MQVYPGQSGSNGTGPEFKKKRKKERNERRWLTPVILATQEVEIKRIVV